MVVWEKKTMIAMLNPIGKHIQNYYLLCPIKNTSRPILSQQNRLFEWAKGLFSIKQILLTLTHIRKQCKFISKMILAAQWSFLNHFVTMVTSINYFGVTSDEVIVVEKPNSSISPVLLCEVLLWQAVQGLSWKDIIS